MNLVVDIRHWLGDNDEPAPGMRKRVLRIARLIEAGGPLQAHEMRETLVECSARPKRKPCTGLLWVIKRRDGYIHAFCRMCESENILIHGWEDTIWAEGPMAPLELDEFAKDGRRVVADEPEVGELVADRHPVAADDLHQAQDLMYQAWETADPKRRIELARKALALSADCADAYSLLARESAKTLPDRMALYEMGVAAGERAVGKRAFEEDVGHFWGILETRPYMRARQGLAQCLWEAGRHDDAIAHYLDMLRLNPGDNQGLRYILAACLADLGRDEDLATLLKEHEDDGAAAMAYTRALLAFRTGGDRPRARKLLTEARRANPHVPAYLAGKKKLPRTLPDYIGIGDENEAIFYAAEFSSGWRKTPGALAWMAKVAAQRHDLH